MPVRNIYEKMGVIVPVEINCLIPGDAVVIHFVEGIGRFMRKSVSFEMTKAAFKMMILTKHADLEYKLFLMMA